MGTIDWLRAGEHTIIGLGFKLFSRIFFISVSFLVLWHGTL